MDGLTNLKCPGFQQLPNFWPLSWGCFLVNHCQHPTVTYLLVFDVLDPAGDVGATMAFLPFSSPTAASSSHSWLGDPRHGGVYWKIIKRNGESSIALFDYRRVPISSHSMFSTFEARCGNPFEGDKYRALQKDAQLPHQGKTKSWICPIINQGILMGNQQGSSENWVPQILMICHHVLFHLMGI